MHRGRAVARDAVLQSAPGQQAGLRCHLWDLGFFAEMSYNFLLLVHMYSALSSLFALQNCSRRTVFRSMRIVPGRTAHRPVPGCHSCWVGVVASLSASVSEQHMSGHNAMNSRYCVYTCPTGVCVGAGVPFDLALFNSPLSYNARSSPCAARWHRRKRQQHKQTRTSMHGQE